MAVGRVHTRGANDSVQAPTSEPIRNYKAIQEIFSLINVGTSLQEVFNTACRALYELFDVDHSGMVRFNADYTEGEVVAEYPELGTRHLRIPVSSVQMEEELLSGKQPFVSHDVAQAGGLGPVRDIWEAFDIQSVLIVPIVIDGQINGSFSLDIIGRTRAFTEEEIELSLIFAAQVAVAIRNARLLEEATWRADQLTSLRETTLAITSELNRETLLQTVVRQAVHLLKGRSGGIKQYFPEHHCLEVIADYGHQESLAGHVIPMGKGIAGQLVQENKPYMIVNKYCEWPGRIDHVVSTVQPGSMVAAVLRWQKRIIGVLYVEDEASRDFLESEARQLQLFADHAAIALINAELADENSKKLARLQALATSINHIMRQLDEMPLDERLNLIAEHATRILDAEACGISLVKEKGLLTFAAGYGYRPGAIKRGRKFEITSGPRTGLTGHIAHEGKLFNSSGRALKEHFAVKADDPPKTRSGQCYSLLAIPLKRHCADRQELIGLLRVENKKDSQDNPGPYTSFSEADESVLQLFADAVVVAVESARLVAGLQEKNDHFERLIATSPDGVIANDRAGRIRFFNDRASEILGYRQEEIIDQHVSMIFTDRTEVRRIAAAILQTPGGELKDYGTSIRSQDGRVIPIRMTATWLRDAHGEVVGTVGYFEDLRDIREVRARIDLLLSATKILTQSTHLEDGLRRLAQMMVTMWDTSFCRILLLDPTERYLNVIAGHSPANGPAAPSSMTDIGRLTAVADWPRLDELLWKREWGLLEIDDQQAAPFLRHYSRWLDLEEEVQSVLLVPLRTRHHRVVGLLVLGHLQPLSIARFSEAQRTLAVAIAHQTAMLIDRVRLLQEAERRGKLLAALEDGLRYIRAEKETDALLQEVSRLAASLTGCTVGGLFINSPHLGRMVLKAVYGLDGYLAGNVEYNHHGLMGKVARTGKAVSTNQYSRWPDHDTIFKDRHLETVIGVPLKRADEVEAVLFVADTDNRHWVDETDLEILERFAAQVSIALQTSRLLDREQRMFARLALLHRISTYIQTADNLDKILHVVLTGITAGYGLAFNRAALLLLDEARHYLVGRMGIGYRQAESAWEAWEQNRILGPSDFGSYIEWLEHNELSLTPIGEEVRQLRLPVKASAKDAFSQVILTQRYAQINEQEFRRLPRQFVEIFEPELPLVIVPLIVRDRAIGILVADNKFTQAPISLEEIELLFTFANTAAVAIDNTQLLQQAEAGRARLHSLYQASNRLLSSQKPEEVGQAIVKQMQEVTAAVAVRMLIIDPETGYAQDIFSAAASDDHAVHSIIRKNGMSMRIIRTGKPELISDAEQARNRVNPSFFQHGIRAAAGLPISVEGKQIGVVWIYYDQPRHFSHTEVEALQFYVNQAALAYEGSRRIARLERMRQAAEALAGASTMAEVLHHIVSGAKQVMQADWIALWSYDEERQRFILDDSLAAIPDHIWLDFRKAEPSPGGTADTVMSLGWIGIHDVQNLELYPFLGQSTQQLLSAAGVHSFQGIALKVEEEKLGVLYVNYERPRAFSEEDSETARTYAHYASLALKKAKLLERVRHAQRTAKIVANLSTLDNNFSDLEVTLDSIVSGTRDALGCDAVTLYVYQQDRNKLIYPPTTSGLLYPERTKRYPNIPEGSLVADMLKVDSAHIVDDIAADPKFRNRRFTRDEGIHSVVAVPLKVGLEKVGVIFVNYRTPHRFTGDELNNLELYVNQAAVAIHNAQLYAREQRRLAALHALYKSIHAVTSSLDLDEILFAIARQASRLTEIHGAEARTSHLALVHGNMLRFEATYPREHLAEVHQIVGDISLEERKGNRVGITGRAVIDKRPVLVRDVRSHLDYVKYRDETQSELAVPILAGDEAIGVINVEHPDPDAFDELDIQALSTLAEYAYIAIRNARLYDHLESVAEISSKAATSLKLSELLMAVCQRLETGASKPVTASIRLYDVGQDLLVFKAEWHHSMQQRIDLIAKSDVYTQRLDEGICGWVATHKEPFSASDVTRLSDPPVPMRLISSTRSEMCVPILYGEERHLIGVLHVQSPEVNAFDKENLKFLQMLADQLAIAICKAQEYEELEEVKGLVGARTALAWMGMASNAWRHSIEGDAINIRNTVTLLRQDIDKLVTDEGLEDQLNTRINGIDQLAASISEKPITPPLSTEEGLQEVEVNAMVRERLKQLWENEVYPSVDVPQLNLMEDDAKIFVSPEWLRLALDLVVDNAIDAMATTTEKRLIVQTRRVEDQIEIRIQDNGIGMSPRVQESLFTAREESTKDGHLGRGLLIVQAIMETYGGHVCVAQTGPEGTTMVLSLPVLGIAK